MNAIAFGTKRAFHGFLRASRKPLAFMGLTAARFDMLAALTTHGLARFKSAYRIMLRAVQLWVDKAICFGQHRNPDKRLVHMDTLEGFLRVLRHELGDGARLHYLWGHPDD